MRIKLLARPDHSLSLYRELLALGVDVDYHTFYAFREGSVWNRLSPTRKTAPASAHTSDLFTLAGYTLAKLGPKLPGNWRRAEQRLAHRLLRVSREQADIVHYWPFYFGDQIRALIDRATTLADYCEAEPSFVNALYEGAYRELGIPFARPPNELVDHNAAFGFERNFVVASELVRLSYRRRFPDASIHVVSYGLLGKPIAQRPSPVPRRRWVFVGRVSIEKGVHTLLDAMALNRDLSLELIGPVAPGQRRYFADRIAVLPNVRAIGEMRNIEVLARLARYDGLVLPSLADAYSLAVIEGICAGLPVVVSDHCGNADDVVRYDVGRVSIANDKDSLARAMHDVAFSMEPASLVAGLRRFETAERIASYGARMLGLYERLRA